MAPPEESTTTARSSSPQLSYPQRSDNIYVTSTHLSRQLSHSLYSKERPQLPSQDLIAHRSNKNEQQSTTPSNGMPGPRSPRHRGGLTVNRFPRVIQVTPKAAKPARYTKDLCPLPSPRRPHVLASERLQCWIPLHGRESAENTPSNLTPEDVRQIAVVIGKSWEESTLAAYGSGLLNFHVYCDQKGIPEDQRAPASPILVNAFISSLAGAYSGSTIDNYLYGIRAWHILHGVRWQMDTAELEALLRAAEKTTPSTSRRKKRLKLDQPRDAAVYSCLTTTFYAAGRLGEFTVPNLTAFNRDLHVKPSDVRIEQDRNGLSSTVFHIPRTKASIHGEDVSWSKQSGDTDPEAALAHHMKINKPPADGHLFSYLKNSRFRPLTKTEFIRTVAAAARSAGLDPRQGHGIRIGSTLEYLLRGTPFEVMKVKGRWASDAFLVYLTKHAQILAPYMQAVPEVHENFVRITMPQIRR
ncbi:hypothetical protein K443DRAFT_101747 [Laccaria amethystina LaAM-08-1]|uniref:DNA breaking-rejoining enzyme n=1 Tax=Laccaria amethystina LaAM-08-1 TaxID=1095629 RepID=A0A0C9XDP4_9AGAR|nr:hypothetical protein K443DRAFT_101747 [Laccaria amethystina LaAM-08-1]